MQQIVFGVLCAVACATGISISGSFGLGKKYISAQGSINLQPATAAPTTATQTTGARSLSIGDRSGSSASQNSDRRTRLSVWGGLDRGRPVFGSNIGNLIFPPRGTSNQDGQPQSPIFDIASLLGQLGGRPPSGTSENALQQNQNPFNWNLRPLNWQNRRPQPLRPTPTSPSTTSSSVTESSTQTTSSGSSSQSAGVRSDTQSSTSSTAVSSSTRSAEANDNSSSTTEANSSSSSSTTAANDSSSSSSTEANDSSSSSSTQANNSSSSTSTEANDSSSSSSTEANDSNSSSSTEANDSSSSNSTEANDSSSSTTTEANDSSTSSSTDTDGSSTSSSSEASTESSSTTTSPNLVDRNLSRVPRQLGVSGLPSIPNVDLLTSMIPNIENPTNINIPNLAALPDISSFPRIPGLTDALQAARNYVLRAIGGGVNLSDGLHQAMERAFVSGDAPGAIAQLLNTILDAYILAAMNCPLIVVGSFVLQEGIRLAQQVAEAARNVSIEGGVTITI